MNNTAVIYTVNSANNNIACIKTLHPQVMANITYGIL